MSDFEITLEEAKTMIWSLSQSIDKLQRKNQKLHAVLSDIVSMPAVREVLAPRGSLGSLLDRADEALAGE